MFLEACRGSGAHSSWPARAWCLQDLGTEIPLLCSAMFAALKMVPTWYPKIAPKLFPHRVQNGPKKEAKMVPTWVLEATRGGPKSAQAAFGLLEASWTKKNTLDRLLAALRTIPRQLSAIIGTKRVPKWTPGHSTQDFNDFRGPKGSFWVQECGPKRGPKRHLNAEGS